MEITPDLITQYGLMQKVSTGHAYLDMLIVMLVPLIIRNVYPVISQWIQVIMQANKADAKAFERIIEHRKNYEYWWSNDDDGPSNTILQKAVINYINTKVEILRTLPRADYQIKNKVKEEKKNMTGEDSEVPDTNEEQHNYDVNVVPMLGTWVDLQNGIEFMRSMEEQDGDGGKKKSKVITYYLKAQEKPVGGMGRKKRPAAINKGAEIVDKDGKDLSGVFLVENFIQEALDLYRKQQAQKIDYSRYLYVPVLSGWAARALNTEEGGGGNNAPSAIYKRYKLSEEKTFASFFHPDKQAIISLVNQFQEKKGKFSIPGYPQKLGFLLYGPPGTGKTSFIKALAQFTKRSVISIPLNKISTNQELMDIMMDQKIKCDGEESCSLPYNKTIFVMEDVDAASAVVQRRAENVTDKEAMQAAALMKAAMKAATSSSASSKKKADGEGGDEKKEGKDAATGGHDSDDEEGIKLKSKSKAFGPMPAFGRSLFGGDDDLNLAGLLNVLDGVVDTPNRIVIMTTNHPEKLDPALIRPGRINKKIYMGRMCTEQAIQMMRHYFGDIKSQTQVLLESIFVDEALSPAELETACADFDNPEDLVDFLAAKFLAAERAAAAVGSLNKAGSYARTVPHY